MFSRILVVLAVAAAGALAQVTCQTSGGSPTVIDAVAMANDMNGNSGVACQNLAPSGGCTTIWTQGSASANLCGTNEDCIAFTRASQAVIAIVGQCANGNGLAGGTNQVTNELRVDLFHS